MFSQACKNGIRAVVHLSVHSSSEKPIRAKTLSENLDIKYHFLSKILQKLAKNDLISSRKGRKGGFYLSENNKENKLSSIITTIDGDNALHKCVLGFDSCNSKNPCIFHHKVVNFRKDLNNYLLNEDLDNISQLVNRNNYRL